MVYGKNNKRSLIQGMKDQIGKQLVFMQYGKQTVVTRYPDMSKLVRSALQKEQKNGFTEAVAYAQTFNNDLVLKRSLQKK